MEREPRAAVILDCYTDEPSGYGVRPYLGTHQIHLSQALSSLGVDHYYLTIDDLRYCSRGLHEDQRNTDLATFNRTTNGINAIAILQEARIIYIIMGCFVDYTYFSAIPPKSDEVYTYLKGTSARKILFYVLGTEGGIAPDYKGSKLSAVVDHLEFGNTYRFIIAENSGIRASQLIEPDYDLLDRISSCQPQIISQLRYPVIAEIETGSGCNMASCTYCIEHVRHLRPTYRTPQSIIKQIKCLYDAGVRHFRLGKQPNFYDYQNQNVTQMEDLLSGIRECCPKLETLHIDNVNVVSVTTKQGIEITKMIARYCTSGNVAPLGIESFDSKVREAIHKVGTAELAVRAVETISEFGRETGIDGFPCFLPGINLMYGLPEQTCNTHKINIAYLSAIMDGGHHTGRLFFRKMTRPTGISFGNSPPHSGEYEKWFEDLIRDYVLPMQSRVYPNGTILRRFREVICKNGDSYLRRLDTCSIRMVVKGKTLKPYNSYDLRVVENLDYRLLRGELIDTVTAKEN